ncbi:MAG TPA: hypothetical protein VEU27_15235 [Gemmatimonadales bacterium]|nr:hypothetical protein [Gemmatimonadales bacterium]
MRHTMRSGALALALVAATASAQLSAQGRPGAPDESTVNMPVPASIHQLEAREVVGQILAQRHDLLLSDQQFADLSGLNRAVRDGRPVYEPTGRTKPPYERPLKITTPEQALARAFTLLTPQQQHQSLMLFAKLEPKPGKQGE